MGDGHAMQAIAGLHGDSMVFKLPDAGAREQALELPGTRRFDPMGGRSMREWVVVPPEHADAWPALAERALGRGA